MQGPRNLLGDVALHRQHVGKVAVVLIGPERLLVRGVDELRAHAHAIAVHPDAAVDEVAGRRARARRARRRSLYPSSPLRLRSRSDDTCESCPRSHR